jgi:hypothetical protein
MRTDAGSTEICNPPNTGCSTQTIVCNEAKDCNGGVCCQTIIGIGLQRSTFCSAPSAKAWPGSSAMYAQGTFQTCRTDGECGMNSDAGALKRGIPQVCTNPQNMSATLTVEAYAEPKTAANDARRSDSARHSDEQVGGDGRMRRCRAVGGGIRHPWRADRERFRARIGGRDSREVQARMSSLDQGTLRFDGSSWSSWSRARPGRRRTTVRTPSSRAARRRRATRALPRRRHRHHRAADRA